MTSSVEGFSGADPYEICEQYAAGLLSRDQLIDELSRWEYTPRARTESLVDDLIINKPGSVADLERALRRGLIDAELYDEIGDLRESFAAGSAMELCQRYAAGLLSRDETVSQLSEWPFAPPRPANEFGEFEQDQSNAFIQVELAADFGLIDDAMYEEVIQRRMTD